MLNFLISHLLELVSEHGVVVVACEALVSFALWGWLVRRGGTRQGWRGKATVAALVLCSVAVLLDVMLALDIGYGSRELCFTQTRNEIALGVMGLVSVLGLLSASVGQGKGRLGAAVLSCWLFLMFGTKGILAVNSFH